MSIDKKCNSCGTELRADETECPVCGAKYNETVSGNYHCANCGHIIKDMEDKFCRYCGATSEAQFRPDRPDRYDPRFDLSRMQILYGPGPVRRTHICPACGFTWETYLEFDKEEYCPKCGGRVNVIKGITDQ